MRYFSPRAIAYLGRTTILALLIGLLSRCSTRTYYVVRHGDRVPNADQLTPAGELRARTLADSLRAKGITALFSTNTLRTRRTALPLSEAISVPITLYGYTNPATQADTLAAFTRLLQRQRNSLVVGHSNTVLDVVRALGASPVTPTIGEGEFDRLFIVRRTKRPGRPVRVTVAETRYGAVAH